MALVDELRSKVDTRDLLVLTLVESFNEDGQMLPTPAFLAGQITGAPVAGVYQTMHRLSLLGVLDERPLHNGQYLYLLTSLGAELMLREIPDWQPGNRQQRRRDDELARAASSPRG